MYKIKFLLISVFFVSFSYGQIPELGLFFGGNYYRGELNRKHLNQQDFSLGLIYKMDLPNDRVSFRFQFMYNRVKGDALLSDDASMYKSNLTFKSSVIEVGPIIEVDFFTFHPGQSDAEQGSFGTPYFFGGINYMHMDPKAQYNGEWISLQPLGTEGQETSFNSQKKYSLHQIVIPFGIGIKVNLSHHACLSMEYGIRKTFTDYLDDVSGLYPNLDLLEIESGIPAADLSDRSTNPEGINQSSYGLQRGNSTDKDWYAVSGFTLTYEFTSNSSCPKW